MENDWRFLMEFGLTQNESKAYLALLDIRRGTAHAVSSRAGMHPKNAYVALEGLVRSGMASVQSEGRTTVYNPENPVNLRRILLERSETLERRLPSLMGQYQQGGDVAQMTVLRGYEGQKVRLDDLLNYAKGGVVRVLSGTGSHYLDEAFYKLNFRKFRHRLRRAGGRMRIIDRDTPDARRRAKVFDEGFEDLVQRRYWKGLSSQQDVTWTTAGELLSLSFFETSPLHLRVVSKRVAQSFDELFDSIWAELK